MKTSHGWSMHSLRFQLLSRSLLILAVLLGCIGALQYVFMSSFLYTNTAMEIQSQIRGIRDPFWIARMVNPPTGFHASQPLAFGLPGSTVALVSPTGQFLRVWQGPDRIVAPHLPASTYQAALTFGQEGPPYQMVDTSAGSVMVVLTPIGPPVNPFGLMQVSVDTASLQQVLWRQLVIFLILSVAALLGGVATWILTLRRTLVPLSQMAESVQVITAGNLDTRVQIARPQTEIAVLADAFNDMLERLSSAFASERQSHEKMRTFLADASHELRTPLTSVHGFIEVLLRGAAHNPEQLRNSLQSMHSESKRMANLVNAMLTLARLDEEPGLTRAPVSLDALILQMEPQFRLLADARQIHVQVAQHTVAVIDPDQIKQVVLNLFVNAVQHTDATAGRIEVILRTAEQQAILQVCDNGEGIPPTDMPYVFERFYRVDDTRASKAGGAGLGLSIAKAIVEGHEGTLTCESRLSEGTVFTMMLPVQDEHPV